MPLTIKNQGGRSAEILFHCDVGDYEGGVGSAEFAEVVRGLGPLDRLTVGINSNGGCAFAGLAIFNFLAGLSDTHVTTRVDALAASAASIILMAGDKIECHQNGIVMVHNCWTIAAGNAAEFRRTAMVMDKLDASLIKTYCDRTKQPRGKVAGLMSDETWLSADEARALGFVDQILSGGSSAKAKIDVQRFKNVPTWALSGMEEVSRKAESGLRLAEIRRRMAESLERLAA